MKEKLIKILILILMLTLIYIIVDIYAAYKTMLQEKLISNISPWVIFINNENIASTQAKTFTINEIIKENSNIADGKIAPGTILQLPIEIDATQTQNIDIKYEIIIGKQDEKQPNLKIIEIIEENLNEEIIKTEFDTYTGIITKENNQKHKLLVNIMWEDDERYNELDTELGTSEELKLLNIPITINVSQYGK